MRGGPASRLLVGLRLRFSWRMAISAIMVSALSWRVKPSGGTNRRLEGASSLDLERLTMTGRPGAAVAMRRGRRFQIGRPPDLERRFGAVAGVHLDFGSLAVMAIHTSDAEREGGPARSWPGPAEEIGA